MELSEIKKRANKEEIDISTEINRILKTIENYPSGMDITVPNDKIDSIILRCDANNIPVYNVAENCLSVAKTYTALLNREKNR